MSICVIRCGGTRRPRACSDRTSSSNRFRPETKQSPTRAYLAASAAMPRVPRRPSDEARRGAYKPPGVDATRSRRRREDRLLALRRRNRDAGLFKRRREEPTLTPAPVVPPSDAAADATAPPPSSEPSSPPSSPPPADALRAAADAEVRYLGFGL